MASSYLRPRSPFFWIKFRDTSGEITRISSGINAELPNALREIKKLVASYTAKELEAPRNTSKEAWGAWANTYFEERYATSPSYGGAMLGLSDALAFFKEHAILIPRQITHALVNSYMAWRCHEKNKALDPICRNSARTRFVYMKILLAEAVRRGYIATNPCVGIRIGSTAVAKVKPEITPDDQIKIVAALDKQTDPLRVNMREQWLVLTRQGCRIAETAVPMDRINTREMTITFKLKGGKMHHAPLHPDLLPLIERARDEGRKTLVTFTPSSPMLWMNFFRKLGMKYSIHCTRVTVITQLYRNGATPVQVCTFIGHTAEVNRIYRRLKPDDARGLLGTLAASPKPSI